MDKPVILPGTSVAVPRIGLGVYQLRGEECTSACLAALEAGYRHFDTAQLYGNEAEVGRAVRDYLAQANLERQDIHVTTKIGRYSGDAGKTYRSALRSVERIAGVDGFVDLFLVHRPVEKRKEMWLALERLLEEGRTRAIGVSNFRIEHLEEMKGYARVWPPVVNQIEIHPWCQQRELVEYCRRHGIVVQAYSPLARGHKMSDPVLARVVERVRRRVPFSIQGGAGGGGVEEVGLGSVEVVGKTEKRSATATAATTTVPVTVAQVLVRWCLQKGYIPLPKSGNPERIGENINVFMFELDSEEMELLDGLDMGAQGALFPANVS
nr:putative aldo/keto reductase [Colletotrichum truncatum]KAF6794501.1 putative aldo/keto reductase [Colletotrichum truncatum]